jgi:hypothetical protein
MRRTRKLALTATALLLLTGAAVGIDELLWRGAHAAAVASAVADAVRDPGSIFAERSPGARGLGLLLQSKPDRVAQASRPPLEGPEERVLAGQRERPPETELAQGGPPFVLNQPPGPELGGPPTPPPGPNFPAPVAGGGPLAPPLLNGPLTPPNSQSTPPGTPPLPPTPVPEPDTWMLMILAIFGVGAALRWKRAAQRVTQGVNG